MKQSFVLSIAKIISLFRISIIIPQIKTLFNKIPPLNRNTTQQVIARTKISIHNIYFSIGVIYLFIHSYYHQNNKAARDGTFKTNENECCAIPFLFYSTFLKVDNCSY